MIHQMKALIKKIKQADIAYYKFDSPIMSDREYDILYEKLVKMENDTGIILSSSPIHKVPGDVLESLNQVHHTKPMLSAQKTKNVTDIISFMKDKAVIVSWKLDGLTLVLRYNNGLLQQALTRGAGGIIGEDVTHTVRTMINVPLSVPYKKPFEVRGEGIIRWEAFNKLISENSSETYSHPRNVASGSVRRLDSRKSKEYNLEFIAFDLIEASDTYATKTEQMDFIKSLGFDTVIYKEVPENRTMDILNSIISSFHPENYEYPVDGLIFEYDNIEYGKSLGATGHHENRMIAFKWDDELVESVFRGVELATTRTGMVSITGIFDDVEIDGTNVNRAYLHNMDILEKYKLGIGDRVRLYKANKIIPQLAENITKSNTLVLPDICPCCSQKLKINRTSNGTRFLFCENPICPAKLVRKFVHFCEKTRMDIQGLSEKQLEKLISNGWVKNFGDLYQLEKYKDEIIATEGFGNRSFLKMQNSINASKKRTLNQLIAGLGIPMVGRHAARILNLHFHGSWDSFEKAIQENFDFTQLQDFGQIMNDNIYTWYSDKKERLLWYPVLEHIELINDMEGTTMKNNNPFNGKTVVATGKLINYTRNEIQTKLLLLGAKTGNSVSKNTDYLIVGENAGSKLQKANQLGIKTLTENEFETMLINLED